MWEYGGGVAVWCAVCVGACSEIECRRISDIVPPLELSFPNGPRIHFRLGALKLQLSTQARALKQKPITKSQDVAVRMRGVKVKSKHHTTHLGILYERGDRSKYRTRTRRRGSNPHGAPIPRAQCSRPHKVSGPLWHGDRLSCQGPSVEKSKAHSARERKS